MAEKDMTEKTLEAYNDVTSLEQADEFAGQHKSPGSIAAVC